MVNLGRPSKNCQPCRKRKLRCDLIKPSCSPCNRAGMKCFGYRDLDELLFRHQTKTVEQKVLAEQHDARYIASSRFAAKGIPRISIAIDVQARHDFFAHYVFGFSESYDVLPSLYEKARPGDHLSTSVDAVSLAFIANNPAVQRKLSESATGVYITALRRVSEALVDPELAHADSTLLCVLLLDLYEKMSNRSLAVPKSWAGHADGAFMLARARGARGLQTHAGRRLSSRLYNTLLISCAVTGARVPAGLYALGEALGRFQDEDDVKRLVTTLNIQIMNFNTDVIEGVLTIDSDIVAEAQRLDALFKHAQDSLPSRWLARRIMLDTDAPGGLVFGNYYDVFEDHMVTQIRNVIRKLRVHINLSILHFASINVKKFSDAAETSQSIIQVCAAELCASVPQFVLVDARAGNRIPLTPQQIMQCYTILDAIYLAARVGKDPNMRAWALRFMDYLAVVGGIEKAKGTADLLRFSQNVGFWEVYASMGGYAFSA